MISIKKCIRESYNNITICNYYDFSFEQRWTIANTGTDQWPGSCKVVQAGGEHLEATPVFVPPLLPGHSTTITMNLVSPKFPGTHRGFFHLLTDKGDKVGGKLFVFNMINISSIGK